MESRRESSPQPSTSKAALMASKAEKNDDSDSDTLPPSIADEEAAIERLEAEGQQQNKDHATDDDDREAKIKFVCTTCDMNEMVHYYGQRPPFATGIKFAEDTYVMRDPFQPPPPRGQSKAEYFVALGTKCSQCDKVVCKDDECSFFYTRTFCLSCGEKQLKSFPAEAQTKLRKQLALKQKN